MTSLPTFPPLPSALPRRAVHALALLALAGALAACQHTREVAEPYPSDYRLRHPIVIKEGDRTIDLLIGRARGALTPAQRADLTSFALKWARESTGGIIVAVPSGSPNARAAHEAVPEIRAVLGHSGVPAQAVRVQSYVVRNPGLLATVRVSYPKMAAQAGPCGMWPQDLGPTYDNKTYMANQPYWNLGCASQRNLAAMVDDPADLVQPRGETPVYAARRTTVIEKYRSGNSPATVYPNGNDGKISDVGK